MNAHDLIDWFLLETYLAGEGSAAERAQVEQWIASHPDHRHIVTRVQAALHARSCRPTRAWRRAEAIDTVMAHVHAGHQRLAATAAPRGREPEIGRTTERLVGLIRQWFEGATELAAAMLLDLNDRALSDDEVKRLRNQIDNAKREKNHERH